LRKKASKGSNRENPEHRGRIVEGVVVSERKRRKPI